MRIAVGHKLQIKSPVVANVRRLQGATGQSCYPTVALLPPQASNPKESRVRWSLNPNTILGGSHQ